MKMVKKILLGVVAGALVLGFVGCKGLAAGDSDAMDTWGSTAKIDSETGGKNETDSVMRGFKMLKTKHLDAMLHITNTPNIIENPADKTGKKTNGVMGYIFNYSEDEATKKSSFTIAGVRYNQLTGTVQAYVDTFKDIDNSKLSTEKFNDGVKATGIPKYTDGGFFDLLDKDTVKELLAENDGKLDLWIDVVANDGESDGRKGTAGSYTVRFFGADPQRKKKSGNGLEYKNANAVLLAEGTIEVANVNNPFVKEGEEKGKLTNMQSDIGYYFNIAANNTLTGNWEFSAIKMEAEEIEE